MATLNANAATLVDVTKRLDPDGKVAEIAEMLTQENEVLMDMTWKEGNLPTGERTTVRTGLPSATWRLFNQGVQPTKSTTAQIDEACGMLEAWSEIDSKLAELNGNASAYRLSEGGAFLEALNEEFCGTLFYGNSSVAQEEFTGLSARYSSLSAANGQNIVDAGGTQSDNASIWLVAWSPRTISGIYPKGSKAGLQHTDHGKQVVETVAGVAGARMTAYRDQWTWDCGIALKDWRYVVRIANIDVSNLTAQSSQADLELQMIKATHRIKSMNVGKIAFYGNRTVRQYLDVQRRVDVKAGGGMNYENVDGKPVYDFRGIPFRICDQLLENETRVT